MELGSLLSRAMTALDNCQARLSTIVESECYEPEVENERCKAALKEAWEILKDWNVST